METDVLNIEKTDEKISNNNSIIIYNDDVNSFDWIIESLIDVCEHDKLQAEQCAWQIHLKGKCDVKNGSYDELEPMTSELLRRNINAEIE